MQRYSRLTVWLDLICVLSESRRRSESDKGFYFTDRSCNRSSWLSAPCWILNETTGRLIWIHIRFWMWSFLLTMYLIIFEWTGWLLTCTLEKGSMTRMRFCSSRLSYSVAMWVLMIGSSLSSALYSVRAWETQNVDFKYCYCDRILQKLHYNTSHIGKQGSVQSDVQR